MPVLARTDWYVTEEKVLEAVRRIVHAADPVSVIVFGSRARGQHRPESDLDLAVVLDVSETEAFHTLPTDLFRGIGMSVDLLPIAQEKYNRFRSWMNTIQYNIDREGIRLYERGKEPASGAIVRQIC